MSTIQTAADRRYCNRCGTDYPPTAGVCPACRCPEFSQSPNEQYLGRVERMSKTKKKAASAKEEKVESKPKPCQYEPAELLSAIEKAEQNRQENWKTLKRCQEAVKEAKEYYRASAEEVNRLARARFEDLPLLDKAPEMPPDAVDRRLVKFTDAIVDFTDQSAEAVLFSAGQVALVYVDADGDLFTAQRPRNAELAERDKASLAETGGWYIFDIEPDEVTEPTPEEEAAFWASQSQAPAAAEQTQADDSWKARHLTAAAFKSNHQDAIEAAGVHTLGELQDKMNRHGQFWARELRINGRFRQAIEDCFNDYLSKFA